MNRVSKEVVATHIYKFRYIHHHMLSEFLSIDSIRYPAHRLVHRRDIHWTRE
ncbi:hypothetical protein PUN4_620084 [Paraburkholderia unamae]|nr:hypothetical protein PUN4_620084 [Paraburkholderia unamae]